MSKETDSIVVVVSEETGKISIAKDGTLIADVNEETLKKILIKNVVIDRLGDENTKNNIGIKNMKNKFMQKNKEQIKDKGENK